MYIGKELGPGAKTANRHWVFKGFDFGMKRSAKKFLAGKNTSNWILAGTPLMACK